MANNVSSAAIALAIIKTVRGSTGNRQESHFDANGPKSDRSLFSGDPSR
jgi:hypothetical protein